MLSGIFPSTNTYEFQLTPESPGLVPIIVKKGRSAHTLSSALFTPDSLSAVSRTVFVETLTNGLRVSEVDQVALERTYSAVKVHGVRIATKTAKNNGGVVNVSVEYEDVLATAMDTGLPAKEILRTAEAAAYGVVPT